MSILIVVAATSTSAREPLASITKPLPWVRVLKIGIGLARGLGATRRRGVLHRDIKPANVMLGDDDEAKLLDFGVAKLADAPAPPLSPAAAPVSPERDPNAGRTLRLTGIGVGAVGVVAIGVGAYFGFRARSGHYRRT